MSFHSHGLLKTQNFKAHRHAQTKPSTETAPEAIASADSVDEIAAAADHRVGGSD